MLLRFETIRQLELSGVKLRHPVFSPEETSGLWRPFREQMSARQYAGNYYSVQIHDAENPAIITERWAAVPEGEGQAPGEPLLISSGLYAVFLYRGGPSGFLEFYRNACNRFLPEMGLSLDTRPHFQVLGKGFNPFSDESQEEVWIPVVPVLNERNYRFASIASISALLSLGHRMDSLRYRISLALETGFAISDLKEVIIQVSLYAGFPRSLNGMACLRTVLEDRNQLGLQTDVGHNPSPQPVEKSRYELGWETLQSLDDAFILKLKAALDPVAPELFTLVLEHGYADIFYRDNLDIQQREAAVVAAMVAVENADPQLSFHLLAGLKTGIKRMEMEQIVRSSATAAGREAAHALGLLANIP